MSALDKNTYGFAKADADELINVIANREIEHYQRVPRDDGGSGGGSSIEYIIIDIRTAGSTGEDAPYAGLRIATGVVQVAPCNRPDLLNTAVDIVDHSGCIFDLSDEDMINIWGWASERIAVSRDPEAEDGAITPCHWSADNRCCEPGDPPNDFFDNFFYDGSSVPSFGTNEDSFFDDFFVY